MVEASVSETLNIPPPECVVLPYCFDEHGERRVHPF